MKTMIEQQLYLKMNKNDFDEMASDAPQNNERRQSHAKKGLDDGFGGNRSQGSAVGFRTRIFRIFYWIQKGRNTQVTGAIILILIMFSQIFSLLISPVMKLPFKGSLYIDVSVIFDVIRIYPAAIRNGGQLTYWFFMYAPLGLTVLYIILTVILDSNLQQTKGKSVRLYFTIWVMQNLQTLFFWVFLIPTVDFYISIFECRDNKHKIVTTLTCWSPLHAFYCALFASFLVIQLTITFFISLLFNESRPSHTDALRRLDTNQELMITLYRVILVVVSHYTADYSSYQWVTLVLHALISIHLYRNYIQFITYYDSRVSKTYGACCLAYLWLIANCFLVKAFQNEATGYEGQIIVIVIGFLAMWPTADYIRKRRIAQIMLNKQQDKIKDDLELDQFIANFQIMIAESELNEEKRMMFLGFLYVHKDECQQSNCPIKNNQNLYLPLSDQQSKRDFFPSDDTILHQHFLNSIYQDYQRSHPNSLSSQHHTQYGQFLFYQIGNVHMSLIELNLAQKLSQHVGGESSGRSSAQSSSSFQQAFTIFKYKQLIEDHLQKKFREAKSAQLSSTHTNFKKQDVKIGPNNNQPLVDDQKKEEELAKQQIYASLDVSIVITFENLYYKFERAIEQSATDHIEFWSHLDSNMIDLNIINKLGLTIINRSKWVTELWSQLTKINPSYPNALFLYGTYLSQIKNDLDQGEEYKLQCQQVKQLLDLKDYQMNQYDVMFADDTAVVVMNGSREQQGKIMKTNLGISKLFGYSQFEVQGHDVNILMPPLIAQKHQFFIESYFKTGKERILNSCIESFAMYRTGVIFPVNLVVKPVPSLKNDIQYIGMIKRSERDYEYIITDENGRIDSISEGVISLLKLPISFFKEHEIPIQILVPELCEVCRPRNQITGNYESATYFDVWNGQKDLKFIVPKNFSNAGGRSGHHFGHGLSSAHHQVNQDPNYDLLGEDYDPNEISRPKQSTFIGMKSPDSLKSVCSMFKNAEHKSQPERYKSNLLNHVNYMNPDFERILKTDIQSRLYGGGSAFSQSQGSALQPTQQVAQDELKIRVFKIYFNKKGKNAKKDGKKGEQNNYKNAFKIEEDTATEASSINEGNIKGLKEDETLMHQNGMSVMQTLNDQECFQKYLELIAQASLNGETKPLINFEKDLKALKANLERQKRIRAQGKIMTSDDQNRHELEKMIFNLREIEKKILIKTGIHVMPPDGQQNKNHKISNPIAAAFAHRLAIFVKSQQPQILGRLDTDLNSNSKRGDRTKKPKIENNEEIKDGGFGAAIALIDEDKMSVEEDRTPRGRRLKDEMNPGKGDWTQKAKKGLKLESRGFVNDYFQKNPMSQTANALINHNDLVKNLQSKFTISYSQSPLAKTTMNNGQPQLGMPVQSLQEISLTGGNELNPADQGDQKSVKLAIDESGSVNSDTKNLASSLKVLRNALYENYLPQSIQNLRYSAQFVAVILIAMTITSFLISQSKYDQLKENFLSVQHSQERMLSVSGINNAARFCLLMNEGRVNRSRYGTGTDFFAKMKTDLNQKAINLQKAQNNLSQTKYDFSSQNLPIINPNNLTLYYNVFEEVGSSQTMNVWAAVMQLSINAFKLKDLTLSSFTPNHMSLWFILKNSLNNLLEGVTSSTDGILADTLNLSEENKHILMILLMVASGGLIASMCIIMPVVTKVHQDKDKLLSLFLLIDPDDVKEQLKRCREFFTTFHANADDAGGGAGPKQGNNTHGGTMNVKNSDEEFEEDEDGGNKGNGRDGSAAPLSGRTPREDGFHNEKEQHGKDQKNKFQRKNKKLKKYSTNYLMLLIKFTFVIAFLESYFLYQYFSSDNFLIRSLSMIKEAATITNRSFSNFLLYQIMIEIVATNGTAPVFNQPSQDYIIGYLDSFNQELETFLKVHSENVDNHDPAYNAFFDNLIYKSVCNSIQDQLSTNKVSYSGSQAAVDEQSECSTYLGGVLEKGLYSANLAYWDDMREIRDGFFKSDRSPQYLRDLLNSQRLIQVERLNEIYFSKAYQALVNKQNESISVQFENRNTEIVALFSVYIALLVLMYIFVWNRFVESMRLSLWVTKSMLAIIPMDVIDKVKVIKDFLFATSQASVRAMKD